jgi:hypothetical protein
MFAHVFEGGGFGVGVTVTPRSTWSRGRSIDGHGTRVDKWPTCYSDHLGTVADEFRNEFVTKLSF